MHLRKSASHNNLLGMIIPPPKKMFQTPSQQHLPKCPNSVFGSFWGKKCWAEVIQLVVSQMLPTPKLASYVKTTSC
jgi:hypothetical protein